MLSTGRRSIAPAVDRCGERASGALDKADFSLKYYSDDIFITAVGDNLEILALRVQTTLNVVEE